MGQINVQIRSERCRKIALEAVKRLAAVAQYELHATSNNKQKFMSGGTVVEHVSERLEMFVNYVCNCDVDITNDNDFNNALQRVFGYDATKL